MVGVGIDNFNCYCVLFLLGVIKSKSFSKLFSHAVSDVVIENNETKNGTLKNSAKILVGS